MVRALVVRSSRGSSRGLPRGSSRLAPFLPGIEYVRSWPGRGPARAHLTALCPKLLSTSLAITPGGWACEQWVLLAQIYPLLGHIMLLLVRAVDPLASPTQESYVTFSGIIAASHPQCFMRSVLIVA